MNHPLNSSRLEFYDDKAIVPYDQSTSSQQASTNQQTQSSSVMGVTKQVFQTLSSALAVIPQYLSSQPLTEEEKYRQETNKKILQVTKQIDQFNLVKKRKEELYINAWKAASECQLQALIQNKEAFQYLKPIFHALLEFKKDVNKSITFEVLFPEEYHSAFHHELLPSNQPDAESIIEKAEKILDEMNLRCQHLMTVTPLVDSIDQEDLGELELITTAFDIRLRFGECLKQNLSFLKSAIFQFLDLADEMPKTSYFWWSSNSSPDLELPEFIKREQTHQYNEASKKAKNRCQEYLKKKQLFLAEANDLKNINWNLSLLLKQKKALETEPLDELSEEEEKEKIEDSNFLDSYNLFLVNPDECKSQNNGLSSVPDYLSIYSKMIPPSAPPYSLVEKND